MRSAEAEGATHHSVGADDQELDGRCLFDCFSMQQWQAKHDGNVSLRSLAAKVRLLQHMLMGSYAL